MRYEQGSRVIVMERGRLSVGSIVEITGDEAAPQYMVQFGEFRTVVYDDKNLLRYTAGRWDTLNNALETIFVGYRSEDDLTAPQKAKPTRPRGKVTTATK